MQGIEGSRGTQGIQGLQGVNGIGIQGLQGIESSQGIQGLQGVNGIGIPGLQGFDGTQGIQGLDGLFAGQGIQGVAGYIGRDGIDGIQGMQGIAGNNGAVGIQGSLGVQGIDGLYAGQGIQGIQGFYGLQGISGILSPWNVQTSTYTAINGDRIIADTSAGPFTVSLPASPVNGYYVQIADGYNWATNNLTVLRNGSTIEGIADDLLFNVAGIIVEFIYNSNQSTWDVTSTIGSQGLQGTQGTQGTQGIQGLQGLQGLLGLQGIQGLDGLYAGQGLQGLQGFPGHGLQGLNGPSGVQGFQGYQGLSGTGGGGSSITIIDDNSTNANYYVELSPVTSGTLSTTYVSSNDLYYNPSTGTLYSTLYCSLSDETLKTNVNPITNAINILKRVIPVEFNWKSTGNKSYGVIAQQLETILPELVSENNGIKSVEYTALMGFLISAVIELDNKINASNKDE